MKKSLLLALLAFMMGLVALSQEAFTLDESLENGDFFYEREDYVEAVYHFQNLIGTDYENANIHFKIGDCFLNIHGEEYKAIPFLEKAVQKMSPKYKKRSPSETNAPEWSLFYLGNAYRIANQLDNALEAYNRFLNLPDFDSNYNLNIVTNQIKAVEKAKIIQDIPLDLEMVNLGSPINSETANYAPVISSDETMLVFMTEQKFYHGIFVSRKEKGRWSEPENITPQVGSDGDVIPTSISSDKQEIYLVKGEDDMRDIYVSMFDGEFWTKMEPLNAGINSTRAETHASISPDGTTLYFASNRRGGYGEIDLYRSFRTPDGDWGPPENLGPTINTEFNENIPFLSVDQKTLFFSSEGHYNMGGYDVFYSFMEETGEWGTPINIGYPINTTGDDLFYAPVGNGSVGYMAKIVQDGSGKEDIYRIEIFPSAQTEIAAVEGILNLEGLDLDYNQSFDVQVMDKATGQILGILRFDKETKQLSYISKSGNLEFKIDKKE